MTIWNARTGETIDEEEVRIAKELWGKATPAARQRRDAKAAEPRDHTPTPLPARALNPKGNYGFPR